MTIIDEKKERIKFAKENGYKYVSYTYSTLQEAQEEQEAFTVAHKDNYADWFTCEKITEDELYTCCIYDTDPEEGYRNIKIIEKGGSPLVARKNAMASMAESLLGDTIDHCLGESARGAIQVLTVQQLLASGDTSQKLVSAKYKMTGDFLRSWLKERHITQNKAAELCSVPPRTFRRWVAGKPPIPKGMWELLQIKSNSL